MNRVLLISSAATLPLLVDASLKGAALLTLAALCALVMRRGSAAARHVVWLAAMLALLLLPVLSMVLPRWRVLPGWAVIEHNTGKNGMHGTHGTHRTHGRHVSPPSGGDVSLPDVPPVADDRPSYSSYSSPSSHTSHPPNSAIASRASVAPVGRPALATWLLPAWAAGCALLLLRLSAAHWLLRRASRRSRSAAGALSEAFAAALDESSVRRPVRLLLDDRRAIPIVWGVFRPRLLLPIEACSWDSEQLRSVLLHELAHIRRRDTLVQWLTQIACALHWWNPLVWLGAWRLHVERERACDDLVLASGVRPSAYAGHLLDVATKLSPARWTAAGGLAMARKSSLEGRLLAVLSDRLNRRGVTRILAAATVALAAAVAIPLAMLRAAEDDKPKADAAVVNAEPKDPGSKSLFEDWKAGARGDGKIPGGRIGETAASLRTFMDLNPRHEQSVKLEPLLKKCDASRDWTVGEAAALLDEIAAVTPRAEWTMRSITERTIHPGKPLPDELANAPWGKTVENGLRTAWLLEPRTETQALDSVMKSRVLFHNSGTAPVCFATENWIQTGGHKTKDANGKEISVWALERMGIRLRMIFRLAPGEYAEVEGHGLGVGSHKTSSEKSIYNVGCWIEAKEGDAVTFTPGNVPVSFQTWINNEGLKNSVTVWLEMIAARVMREGPMPAAAADREQLLRRVMHDFPGTAPTAEEIAAFTADNAPDALAKLTARLQERAAAMHFAGELSGGETKFRVTAPAQNANSGRTIGRRNGETLPEGTEAQLDWGEAVNGLRGTVLVRSTQPGEPSRVYLAVQNVSSVAIRFNDTIASDKLRKLYLSDSEGILFALRSGESTQTDVLLHPREVVFLPMFPPDKAAEKSAEAALIEGLRKDSLQTWKAVLDIEKAPDGAWKGKLTTAETRGATGTEGPQPKTKEGRALFKVWQGNARLNGDIPGGLLSRLHDKVKEFIRNNTGDASGDPYAKKMASLEPRFGAAGDWKPADVVALLDDIVAVTPIPLEVTMDHTAQHTLRHGPPLPAALQSADWGEPLDGGLRMAFLLEPRAEHYHLGTEVKARILLHNAGKEPVAFITSSFQQPGHKAKLANGQNLNLDSTFWTTLGRPDAYRLGPGEYCEVNTPGIGIGPRTKDRDDWSNVRAGSWIHCGAGDEVVLSPGSVALSPHEEGESDPGWWLEFITERLGREAPVPMEAKEREYLLYRVARDLFGSAPSVDEGNAFAADKSPDALGNLALMLSKRKYITPCNGAIAPGVTKFRVLPPDADAAKRPRVAMNPGRYNLGDELRLVVTRRAAGARIVNHGSVTYYPRGKDNISHDLKLPEGYHTWAAAWGPGTTELWLTQKGLLRKIDFTNPASVGETRYEGDETAAAPVPIEIREALRAALDVPEAPKQQQQTLNPEPAAAPPATLKPEPDVQPKQGAKTDGPKEESADANAAKAPHTATDAPKTSQTGKPQLPNLPDEAYTRTGVHCQKFREEDAKRPGGELMGGVLEAERGDGPLVLGLRLARDAKWNIGGEARVQLVVRNASSSDVKFAQTPRSDNGLEVVAIDNDGKEYQADIAQFDGLLVRNHLLLPAGYVVKVKSFTLRFDAEKRGVSEPAVAAFHLPPGNYTLRCKWGDAHPAASHEGEWTGELMSLDHKFTLSASATQKISEKTPDPRVRDLVLAHISGEQPKSGATLKPSTEQKLKWGAPANGLRMALAWPPSLGEPGMGDAPGFYLVVQNVSQAAVRLTANDAAPNPRQLIMMRSDGIPLSVMGDPTTMPGDWLLQPREVAFLRLFQPTEKPEEGRKVAALMDEAVRVNPQYSHMAEMSIEKAPFGAWTGKLATAETRGSVDVIPPKRNDARALYTSWTSASRTDGKIPGALIGKLAEDVRTFIKSNPKWATTPQLAKMLPRFDASRDWSGQDAVALLDELAAVQESPISAALEHENADIVRTGMPLPQTLVDAPWGSPLTNGLRLAWLLEPRVEARLGTPLLSRILIHNTGKSPVVFRTRTWHQGNHKARDAKGADIKVEAVTMLTRAPLVPVRLAPGEYVELNAPGVGVGRRGIFEDWQHARVGSWIEAKAGDEVTVTTEPVPLHDWNEEEQLKLDGEPRWWLDHIRRRLSRHQPFPADAEARLRLLHRVAIEVLGTSVSKEMNDAFVADATPTALDSAAMRLFHRPGLHAWAGPLVSGPTQLRVLEADPDAAKKPRTASNPGEYTLGGNATLTILRRPLGERIVNKGNFRFSSTELELELPDGYGTWAAAWMRGGTVLWISEKGLLRKVDFTNPWKIEETRFGADTKTVSADIREALAAALAVPDAPKQQREPLSPAPAAPAPATPKQEPPKSKPKDGAEAKLPGGVDVKLVAADAPAAPPPKLTAVPSDPIALQFASVSELYDAVRKQNGPTAASAILSVDIRANTLRIDPSHPDAAKVRELITRLDQRLAPVAEEMALNFGMIGIKVCGPGDFRSIFEVWPNTPAAKAGIVAGDYILGIDGVDTKDSRIEDLVGMIRGQPGTQVVLTLKKRDTAKVERITLIRIARVITPGSPKPSGTRAEAPKQVQEPLKPAAPASDAPKTEKRKDGAEAKPAADGYTKSGMPVADLEAPMTWSAEQNGLCLGMHIPEDADWRIGKEVKVALWVCNPGGKDVKFENIRRNDLGLRVLMTGKDGKEHAAGIGMMYLEHQMEKLLLPAAYAVKVREFSVVLSPPQGAPPGGMQPRFTLEPGEYTFRCEHDLMWTVTRGADGKPLKPAADVRTGLLKSGEVDVMLVGADAPAEKPKAGADSAPKRPKLPATSYTKSGVPVNDLDTSLTGWSGEKNGLCLGLHVPGDADWRIGGEVKIEMWVCNPSGKEITFSQNARADVGLALFAEDKAGKEHHADIAFFSAFPVFNHILLPPGHIVKVKEFTVKLEARNESKASWSAVNLAVPPGDYTLRVKWSDSHSLVTHEGDWTGELTSSDVSVKIAAASGASRE